VVILIDSLLVGGVRFVLDKLVQAVDSELNDDTLLREELLAAQMRLELGEITEEEYTAEEKQVFQALRDIRARKEEMARAARGDDDEETGIGIYTGYGE
jgi:hypothetical protein